MKNDEIKHAMNKELDKKKYWQENIEAFGKFYDKQSEEKIIASKLIGFFYRKIIFPMEKEVTLERYKITVNFIERNVRQDMKVVDLGCGTGVFTTELLLRGAKVLAVDYVEPALSATKKRVEEMLPDLKHNVEYVLLDIMKEPLPKSDIVMAIGVTPYVDSIETFFDHILPTTDIFFCLFLNEKNWMNKIRRHLVFLNVRRYKFFDTNLIDKILCEYEFERTSREYFGTCFLDELERHPVADNLKSPRK